ncbi:Uncharacterised protein [uncultured archaeon]|nr:Uncharacterised protein [uncultured archaeon]
MEPILPFTGWLSIQYMRDTEIRNLKRQLRRKVLNVPTPVIAPGIRKTIVLDPHVEPHNCLGMCGNKTNWLVWEQVDAVTRKHIASIGMCLNCAEEMHPESGFCDYPDAGWGVHELTIDEEIEGERLARLWFAGGPKPPCGAPPLPERPLTFCTPWQR